LQPVSKRIQAWQSARQRSPAYKSGIGTAFGLGPKGQTWDQELRVNAVGAMLAEEAKARNVRHRLAT
jgi:hypothetical protein